MKNITVSVDHETHRQARIRAAELGTSVSALVREYLRGLSAQRGADKDSNDGKSEIEHHRSRMNEVLADFDAKGVGLRMSENLSREDLYDEVLRDRSALR